MNATAAKKYEFTGETMENGEGVTLRRIRYIANGELGGWLEKEENLAQYGDARVFGDAWVYGDARVYGSAQVSGSARVFGDAWVYGSAQVFGDAWVSGSARVSGAVRVSVSHLTTNYHEDLPAALRCSLNTSIMNGTVRLYKFVRRINETTFASNHDPEFVYRIGDVVAVDAHPDKMLSCATGLHASTMTYWENVDGVDAVIAVDIAVEDIICVLEGKVRCKKLTVVGVVENAWTAQAVQS